MTALILTILCSSSIALILKYNDTKSGNALLLLTGNYFTATILGFLMLLSTSDRTYSWISFFLGLVIGALFVFSFFSFAKSVSSAGTALATISSRLSVVIPTLFSIVFFNELPGSFQMGGFFFALLTILLFYFSLKTSKAGKLNYLAYFYLFALLLGIGINDFSLKVFNMQRPESDKQFFLLVIFFSAFIYSTIVLGIRKVRFEKSTFLRGTILGIPNILSSYFLINALLELPAIIVYPVTNIGIILLTLALAFILWREKLNRFGVLALITGSIAIILLTF